MSRTTRIIMSLVVGLSLAALSPAAMDDVMVWPGARTENQLNSLLDAGGMPVAALDDVVVWDGAYTQEQIEALLQGGQPLPSAIDDVVIWNAAYTKEQLDALLQEGWPQPSAIADVIIWDGVRSVAQIEDTLQNGYASTAGMRLWWDFADPCNLGADATGNGYNGATFGNVYSLVTETPAAANGRAVGGFTSNDSMIVGNPQLTSPAYYQDRTYEMWIRNPRQGDGVFFAITGTEAGGGDFDVKRMWVNADGSITMADRGSKTSIQLYTTSPLTWDADAWYQITVIYDYTTNDYHDVRVYRGRQGESAVELLLDYQSSSFGNPHYLAVGGHPQGYYAANVGKGGFFGATGPRLWWSFNDADNLGADVSGNNYNANVYGNAVAVSTETPTAADGRAAGGFTSNDSMIVGNPDFPSARYYDRTYQMWVRNPRKGNGVFFSITSTEMGGGDADIKRLWVNEDGSLTMADRGYFTSFQVHTTDPNLPWDVNAWYQVTVVYDYTTGDNHDIRVYRARQGDSEVELLLDYASSSPTGAQHWLAVGGHPQGYYGTVGKGGYMGVPGPRLWWSFNDADNLGADVSGNDRHANVYGNVLPLETDTPAAANGQAAGGFTTNDSMVVGNLLDTQASAYYNRTYQMWIRNPRKGDGVFFALTNTEMGGGDNDVKRMWVNDDGSITMADRGYGIGINTYTSDPLTWEADAWYQITLVHDYSGVPGGDNHAIRVYRGKQGDSQVELLFDYQSTRFGSLYWLAVGGHPQGYYWQNVGKGGHLGEMPRMWWDFAAFEYPGGDDPNITIDATGNGYDGILMGQVYQLATDTPSAGYSEGGLAASGFNNPTSMIKIHHNDVGNANYWTRTYTMWIRNPAMNLPLDNMAVFFSLTSETGGGDADFKRVWVDKEGRLVSADRGYYTSIQVHKTEPLTWAPDRWYMIAYVFQYTASDRHNVRIYRGRQGDSAVELLIDYESSSAVTSQPWLKVGGHPVGYSSFVTTVGQQGYLGPDDWGTVLDCADALARGHRAAADLSADCYVDELDLHLFVEDWTRCTDPAGADCTAMPGIQVAPGIVQGSAVVDGLLDDWDDADWIAADQAYYPIPGGPLPPDVSNARWAARWDEQTNLIYLAASVEDTVPRFTSDYVMWNAHDHLEIYVDAGNQESMAYGNYTYGQHYNIGYDGAGGHWIVIGDGLPLPTGQEPAVAVTVDGSTINYEIALPPFTEFYLNDPNSNQVRTLEPGQIIGLDVVFHTWYAVGPQNGMVCENTMTGKFNDAAQFRKAALEPLTCGHWGYLPADLDGDCYVNLFDFAVMAAEWMSCIDPEDPLCDRPWEIQ